MNRSESTNGVRVAPSSVFAQQLAIVEERIAATNEGNWQHWEWLHTPDAVRTAPELESPIKGANFMRRAIETIAVAFPDYRLKLIHAFGDGEWVTVRMHATGTQTGPLVLGDTTISATGRAINQEWVALMRFRGSKIAEVYEYYDQYLLLMQLGLLPLPH